MTLWEFNACIKAYNKRKQNSTKEQIGFCWQTAAFTGAAFNGKLKRLNHYLKDDRHSKAPQVDRDEFERKLKLAREARDG